TMPTFLRKENAKQVPSNALWLSNGLIQLMLIITLFNDATYLNLLYLATSMILVPYFWSAAYAVLVSWRGETYENAPGERRKDLLIALDRKSTRLNSSHVKISYAVFCLKKKIIYVKINLDVS